mmetsp:Transcript_48797/g.80990  ORF Transcript_48797/g.80990 Transcript_48797/m.80990 type:complete len:226 (-) Transcript_48797:713-1390(-)
MIVSIMGMLIIRLSHIHIHIHMHIHTRQHRNQFLLRVTHLILRMRTQTSTPIPLTHNLTHIMHFHQHHHTGHCTKKKKRRNAPSRPRRPPRTVKFMIPTQTRFQWILKSTHTHIPTTTAPRVRMRVNPSTTNARNPRRDFIHTTPLKYPTTSHRIDRVNRHGRPSTPFFPLPSPSTIGTAFRNALARVVSRTCSAPMICCKNRRLPSRSTRTRKRRSYCIKNMRL